jgi:hypothetical protein
VEVEYCKILTSKEKKFEVLPEEARLQRLIKSEYRSQLILFRRAVEQYMRVKAVVIHYFDKNSYVSAPRCRNDFELRVKRCLQFFPEIIAEHSL